MSLPTTASSARNLFVESKGRLADRIQVNVNSVGSLARQTVKGSKSNEILMHTARNFALLEFAVENSEMNLKRMQQITSHLQLQSDNIQRNVMQLDKVVEQLHHISC